MPPGVHPTPPMATRPLADLVSRARIAFTNARAESDIGAALTPFGYTAERLDDLLDLVGDVEVRTATQGREYGEQYAATTAAEAARAALEALFARHRQIARIVYRRGTDAYRGLALDGRVADATAALVAQAGTFYRILADSPDLAGPLAALTLDAAAIADGLARVEAVQAAVAAQAKETGEAQRATAERDDAATRLRAAYADFVAIAKLALSEMPQARERLGLLERS